MEKITTAYKDKLESKELDFDKLMKKFNEISNHNLNLKDDLKRMEIEIMDLKILVSLLLKCANFARMIE
jgi:hypothetical protein